MNVNDYINKYTSNYSIVNEDIKKQYSNYKAVVNSLINDYADANNITDNFVLPVYIDNTLNDELSKIINTFKNLKIKEIKDSSTAESPVEVVVDLSDGTQHSIIFNGGDASASAISGAVSLAQNLGETSVKLWDIENVLHEVSLTEALDISAFIAKEYRNKMYLRQEAIMAVNTCVTIEELEALGA